MWRGSIVNLVISSAAFALQEKEISSLTLVFWQIDESVYRSVYYYLKIIEFKKGAILNKYTRK